MILLDLCSVEIDFFHYVAIRGVGTGVSPFLRDFVGSQSKSLGALRRSGCEVGLCERVDDDRLAFRGRGDAEMSASVPVVR